MKRLERTLPPIRMRAPVAALLAVAALGVVAGCGSDDDGTTSAAATASAETTAPAATATTPEADVGDAAAGSGVTDYLEYVGGTAGKADPSKEPVVVGWVNQQGGSNDVGPGATDGAKLAETYINDELGGIGGRPLKLKTCFISTAEEQGQACGQEMANDQDVDVVGVGAVAIGAQPLQAAIGGEKPMVWGVSVNQVDTKAKDGFILFGDSFHILAPWGTFGRDVLKAKTAAVIYPEVPGIIEGADAMVKGLEAAGLEVKRVGYAANATDLVGPLTAAGAQSTDMIVPQSDAKGCVNLAKALEQSGVKAEVVSNPLCLSPIVAEGLGGDVPKWYYGIASTLASDASDPAAQAFVEVAKQYGEEEKAADAWFPTAFAQILTIAKWMNAAGLDDLSSEAIVEQAQSFDGPMAYGAPTLECGKYDNAPAVCNDQTKFYKYEGNGKFEPASGWVRPPE